MNSLNNINNKILESKFNLFLLKNLNIQLDFNHFRIDSS